MAFKGTVRRDGGTEGEISTGTDGGGEGKEHLTSAQLAALDKHDDGGDLDPAKGTSLEGVAEGDGEGPGTATATWPDAWREEMVGGDAKMATRLKRYNSPEEVGKALIAAQNKISSGEHKQPALPPENPTDKQLASWRKENGIPEEPTGYLKDMPDGIVIGEMDKPLAEGWATYAHTNNLTPDAMHHGLAFYYANEAAHLEALDAGDKQAKEISEDTLSAEWGSEFRPGVKDIDNFLNTAPAGIGDSLKIARGADGHRLMNNVDMLRWLRGLATEHARNDETLPGSGTGPGGNVEDRIKEIEATMREDRQKYNANNEMQAELRDLYDRRARASARKAAA